MSKIVFFNHLHRGDLHTHKAFIAQIQNQLPDIKLEYLHKNPSRLTDEYNIPLMGTPDHLERNVPFYQDVENNTLYINTWVATNWERFCKHGGVNMNLLIDQWTEIFDTINKFFSVDIKIRESKEFYLPLQNQEFVEKKNVDSYIESAPEKRVLVCNNVPASGQSFADNLSKFLIPIAEANPGVDIICTDRFETSLSNIKFTSDIIKSEKETDLLEISYLSSFCNVIIGKNSGPYVFCETFDNYMNSNKTMVSFNKINREFDSIKETMSLDLSVPCKYIVIPIQNVVNLTDSDINSIREVLEKVIPYEKN
jgi:hypothetical protein